MIRSLPTPALGIISSRATYKSNLNAASRRLRAAVHYGRITNEGGGPSDLPPNTANGEAAILSCREVSCHGRRAVRQPVG